MLFTFACDMLLRIRVNFMKDRIKNRSDLSRLESWAQSKARKYYRDTNKTFIEVQKCGCRNAGWKDGLAVHLKTTLILSVTKTWRWSRVWGSLFPRSLTQLPRTGIHKCGFKQTSSPVTWTGHTHQEYCIKGCFQIEYHLKEDEQHVKNG